jgi:membrane peptidoglycan carboxypeptidase
VRLLELAGAYRSLASRILADPHVVESVTDTSGAVLYEAATPRVTSAVRSSLATQSFESAASIRHLTLGA